MRFLLCLAAAAVLSSCSEDQGRHGSALRTQEQTSEEIAFAATTLDALQALSFRNNREYCGYIGLNKQGELAATREQRGRQGVAARMTRPEVFKFSPPITPMALIQKPSKVNCLPMRI